MTNSFQCLNKVGAFSATYGPGKGKGDGSLHFLPNLPNRESMRLIIYMASLLPLLLLNISVGWLKIMFRKCFSSMEAPL